MEFFGIKIGSPIVARPVNSAPLESFAAPVAPEQPIVSAPASSEQIAPPVAAQHAVNENMSQKPAENGDMWTRPVVVQSTSVIPEVQNPSSKSPEDLDQIEKERLANIQAQVSQQAETSTPVTEEVASSAAETAVETQPTAEPAADVVSEQIAPTPVADVVTPELDTQPTVPETSTIVSEPVMGVTAQPNVLEQATQVVTEAEAKKPMPNDTETPPSTIAEPIASPAYNILDEASKIAADASESSVIPESKPIHPLQPHVDALKNAAVALQAHIDNQTSNEDLALKA